LDMPLIYWVVIILTLSIPGIKSLVVEGVGLFNPSTTIYSSTMESRIDEIEKNNIAIINATAEVQKATLELKELSRSNKDALIEVKVKVDRNEKDIQRFRK